VKALITGPRSHGQLVVEETSPGVDHPRFELPYLNLETEFEELPKAGEHIIINDGNSVTVKQVMWWVDGPDTPEAYSFNGGMYEGEGVCKGIHILVEAEPPYEIPYDAGVKAGRKSAANDLDHLLALLHNVQDGNTMHGVLAEWIKKELESS
jgi:hypothetical protein